MTDDIAQEIGSEMSAYSNIVNKNHGDIPDEFWFQLAKHLVAVFGLRHDHRDQQVGHDWYTPASDRWVTAWVDEDEDAMHLTDEDKEFIRVWIDNHTRIGSK